MARITVLGGTGYAGRHIVEVAANKGHHVMSWSRNAPENQIDGVDYRAGDVADLDVLASAIEGSDVVVSALSPRGTLSEPGALRALEQSAAEFAQAGGVRFGVVGGAGSLLVAEGGPKVAETDGFPEEIKAEAAEMDGVLQDLRTTDPALDWFFVSPAGGFGPWAPGELTGTYRIGGDVLLVDENGDSAISGPDLADAVVAEIENPAHQRARFTVAY